MNRYLKLILCLLGPLAIGAISGLATSSSINNWYLTLNKPSFNPPNYLFGPVWTFLYLLMGVSLFLIIEAPGSIDKQKALIIFTIQIFLNFCWSFLFFKFHWPGIALVEIILIWSSILSMIITFRKLNKIAAYIQIPYLLWVSFATILNASIWYLN